MLGEAPLVVVVEAAPPLAVLVVVVRIPVRVTLVEVPSISVETTEVVGVTTSVFSGTVLGLPLGVPVKIGGSNGPDDGGIDSVKNVSVTSPVTVAVSTDEMSGVRVGTGLILLPTGSVDVNSGSGLNGGERSVV